VTSGSATISRPSNAASTSGACPRATRTSTRVHQR
jgi:hypothetical protein